MSEEQIALARRAVACKGWRFMSGMLLADGARQARVGERFPWREDAVLLPVLQDPATLGCLPALVREAWECAVIVIPDYEYDDEARQGPNILRWRAVETARWMTVGDGVTEAEALVAALEAAPKRGEHRRGE